MLAATLRTRLAATLSRTRLVAASARSLCTLPELVTTRSGLRYRDVGTPNAEAPMPSAGDTVAVHYTGRLDDGTVFDSSHDRGAPIEFPLGEGRVIKGWDEGIASMRVRQKRQLVIEPHLGYGARGAPPLIPPNALLHFDVRCHTRLCYPQQLAAAASLCQGLSLLALRVHQLLASPAALCTAALRPLGTWAFAHAFVAARCQVELVSITPPGSWLTRLASIVKALPLK